MPLSIGEKFELIAIPVVVVSTAILIPQSGTTFEIGELITGGALLLLLQGFFRDLWLLRQSRRSPSSTPTRSARCMCVESTVGLTGVIAGIALVGFGLTRPIHLSVIALVFAIASILVVGFLLKDFVFEWSPWKIHREKDHSQVIFRWRK
ncbi:MAG TPA: hypothetical protein VGM64_11950 [Lacunisphaera sp.]|jgi:hypothetical protein